MIATTALYLVYLFFAQPYEDKRQNQLSLLNEFFVLVISCCLIGFCNENLSSDGEEALGWFLIAWINVIAGFNMLLALYKTVKETYDLLRQKCCPQKKIHIPGEDDETPGDAVEQKVPGTIDVMDLEVISLNEDQMD